MLLWLSQGDGEHAGVVFPTSVVLNKTRSLTPHTLFARQGYGEHAGVVFPTSVALNKMCGRVAPLPGGRSDRLLLPGDLVKVRYGPGFRVVGTALRIECCAVHDWRLVARV